MEVWVKRHFVRPLFVSILAAAVAGTIIVLLGKVLLHYYDATIEKPEYERSELWVALGFAAAIMVVASFLATRPKGSLGPLDREVAIGSAPMFAPEPPPIDVRLRQGTQGKLEDIQTGYTLYARNGALAKVLGIVPGTEEFGRQYKGFIYAQGLYGASDELWIPFEAVMAVYPETQSVFLAIKGDETETFGWNKPPANISRTPDKGPAPL